MGAPADHASYLQPDKFAFDLPGLFTEEEATTLTRFGHWMQALSSGVIAPATAEQTHFVRAARGEAAPTTPFEWVWAKYCSHHDAPAPGGATGETGPPNPLDVAAMQQAGELCEELAAARWQLEQTEAKLAAEREAVLDRVRAELDAVEARYAAEVEEHKKAVETCEAEVRGAVVRFGRSVRIGKITVAFHHGRTGWDSKGLAAYARSHPDVLRFRKVGEPMAAIRYK